jgi:hypothetical protein
MITVIEAIRSIRPDSQFVIKDNDLESIEWIVVEGGAPTKTQIQKAIKDLEEAELNAFNLKKASKASAIAKLESLGLNLDEAKAIIE